MKRDWDLIREVLIASEELPSFADRVLPGDIEGWHKESVSYHIHLLISSGLVEGKCTGGEWQLDCYARQLTHEGHEFLAAIRDKRTFQKITALVKDKAVSLSYDVIKQGFLQLVA